MNILNLIEYIFRCALIIAAVYHIFRHDYKKMKGALLATAMSFLPALLNYFFHIEIDVFSNVVYDLIIIMALYLGSSLGFYDQYKWWDRMIHFLSGVGFVGFGIALTRLDPGIVMWGVLLFGFTFSVTLHVFWEVLEYASDCFTHGDAQRWQKHYPTNNHVSKKAIQPAGLVDTMNDLICCLLGAALAVIIWLLIFTSGLR